MSYDDLHPKNKSGYRGVSWDTQHKSWRAGYKLRGQWIELGLFDDVHDAGIAASDFRLQHKEELNEIERLANISRSKKVTAYKAKLPKSQRSEIARKGHASRRKNALV